MRRRTLLLGTGTAIASGLGIATLSQDTQAASVGVNDLSIPDESIQTNRPVSGLHVTIQGPYSWSSTQAPTRAVLRLSVTRTGDTAQLSAKSLSGHFTATQDGDYAFQSVNLLDHPQVTAPMLSPQDVGDEREITLTFTVTLGIYHGGRKTKEVQASDTATITVTKTAASVEAELSGTGDISVITATP